VGYVKAAILTNLWLSGDWCSVECRQQISTVQYVDASVDFVYIDRRYAEENRTEFSCTHGKSEAYVTTR